MAGSAVKADSMAPIDVAGAWSWVSGGTVPSWAADGWISISTFSSSQSLIAVCSGLSLFWTVTSCSVLIVMLRDQE
jgi:hypothetical protein